MATQNGTRIRQFTLCQFENNPRTGDFIQPLTEIADRLTKYKTFAEWAWVIHDRDIYTQDAIDDMNATLESEAKKQGLKDEASIAQYVANNRWAALGQKKQTHIHIVCKLSTPVEIYKIAQWLGVPEHLVHIIKGKGAFLDCTEYLTHEDEKQQQLGKVRYNDNEVHTSVSFSDWRQQLDNRKVTEAKYGKGKTTTEKFILDVLKYGKTLNQCKAEMDGNEYVNNLGKLQKARAEYLMSAPLPNTRITFYVCGDGGIGKGIACELLARALCPDIEDIQDVMFGIGNDNASFDGYDGQPVIIWQEMRAADLMSAQGRRTTLIALEPHPRKGDGCVNVKYGKTNLINSYNIINGVDPYDEFIKALAGEYTDKRGIAHHAERRNMEQFERRVPIIIPISEQQFDILINAGVFAGTREYNQYVSYASMVGNFARLQALCGTNQPLLIDMSKPMIDPIVEVSKHLKERLDTPALTEAEVRAKVKSMGYGVRINPDGTTDPQTQAEYEQFRQVWQQVYPDKDPAKMMTLREWAVNGRCTAYDYTAKRWYRPEPEQMTFFDPCDDEPVVYED